MQDDDAPDAVARALDAWTPLAPPADFADRVLAAREDPPVARTRRRAWWLAGIAGALAAASAAVVVVRSPHRAAEGALVAAQRTTRALGDRGTAVAEAGSQLAWRIDDRGAAEITQRTGSVFYRVE